METLPNKPTHFSGKEAIEHVIEAQTKGLIASSEIHGTEIPGPISAATDATRETCISFIMLWLILDFLDPNHTQTITLLIIFACGWFIWKVGRSAWLGWSRLERLHRIIAEERWEIEHHRQQEREELKALYAAKGFEGKLLEDVLDVLMADGDRLLRVMLEEEMGMTLAVHEHPLKQALGAGIGVVLTSAISLLFLYWMGSHSFFLMCLILIGIASAFSARYEKNKIAPAIVWNLGIAIFFFGTLYFLLEFIQLKP